MNAQKRKFLHCNFAELVTSKSQNMKRVSIQVNSVAWNREYLAPQITSMNNRFHSEAKLPRSYDYPLANHIATNKSSANHEMPLFSRLYLFRASLENVPTKGFKILPIKTTYGHDQSGLISEVVLIMLILKQSSTR